MSDLIRRQDAELILAREMYATALENGCDPVSPVDFLPEAKAWMSDAPTTGGWIPCSERLPEPLKAVLITWINDNPPEYYASMKGVPFIDEAFLYDGKWYWWSPTAIDIVAEYGERCFEDLVSEDIEVIAWMPLPKPYKGGERSEE